MSNVSTESKVSKNFRMDRLLRDSGNIIEQEPAAAVPPNPPMALNVVGTSKSAMALAASVKQLQPQQQQMMVPTSTIGNFLVPFTPSPSSMAFPTPPGGSSSSGMPMAAFMSPPFMAPPTSSPATANITTPQLHPMQMFYNNPQLLMAATAAYFQQQQQRNQQMAMLQQLMTPSTPAAVGQPQQCHMVKARCYICGKVFSRPWLLNRHRRVHSIYGCNQCGKVFKLRSYLRKHIRANVCRQ